MPKASLRCSQGTMLNLRSYGRPPTDADAVERVSVTTRPSYGVRSARLRLIELATKKCVDVIARELGDEELMCQTEDFFAVRDDHPFVIE